MISIAHKKQSHLYRLFPKNNLDHQLSSPAPPLFPPETAPCSPNNPPNGTFEVLSRSRSRRCSKIFTSTKALPNTTTVGPERRRTTTTTVMQDLMMKALLVSNLGQKDWKIWKIHCKWSDIERTNPFCSNHWCFFLPKSIFEKKTCSPWKYMKMMDPKLDPTKKYSTPIIMC